MTQTIKLLAIIFVLITDIIYPVPTFAVSAATPIASPSAIPSPIPTAVEEEKIQEIRQAIKDKLTQIKEKIEKKAYVGTILEITDSTLSLTSFRGKQRVRLTPETTIIGSAKKEITVKDLAVEDKIIAMGEVDENETLEAKRVIVIPKPTTLPTKRQTFYGTISKIDTKTSTISLINLQNPTQVLVLKTDKNTKFINSKDIKSKMEFKDLEENKKIIVVYLESADNKTPVAKTIFLLPS